MLLVAFRSEVGYRIVALTGIDRRLAGLVIMATEGQGRVLWPNWGSTDSYWEAAPALGK